MLAKFLCVHARHIAVQAGVAERLERGTTDARTAGRASAGCGRFLAQPVWQEVAAAGVLSQGLLCRVAAILLVTTSCGEQYVARNLSANGRNFRAGWGGELPVFQLSFAPTDAEAAGIIDSTSLELATGEAVPVAVLADVVGSHFTFRIEPREALANSWHRVVVRDLPQFLDETVLFQRRDGPASFWFHPLMVVTPVSIGFCDGDDFISLRLSAGTKGDIGKRSFLASADGLACDLIEYPKQAPEGLVDGLDYQCPEAIRDEARPSPKSRFRACERFRERSALAERPLWHDFCQEPAA